MAFAKNGPQHKRREESGLSILPDERYDYDKKRRNDLRGIRAMGLTAIILGVVALILLGVKLLEGEAAGRSANALLEAYQAKATVSPASTLSPSPTAESETPGTPEPTDENYEQTDAQADLSAAAGANEHLADDGSNAGVIESGEYVQPEAPEVSELDATIEKIIKATGEDGVIGILEIPEYEVKLPIIGKWSYKLLKISVCRYKGPNPLEEGNLVIIGHNYKSGAHFGVLKKLEVGDEIFLTSAATGQRVRYEVYEIKSVAADAFSSLKSFRGDAGLTLLTCKDNGTNRLLVRCEQKEAS